MADVSAAEAWPAPPAFYCDDPREPPAPVLGEFSMYGVTRTTEPPEAPALEEQIYQESASPCAELRRLHQMLLGQFVELLKIAEDNPSSYMSKVAEVRTLLLNLHHLLNALRPYEAREQLIAALEAQVEKKRRAVEELREADAAAAGVLLPHATT